MPRLSREDEPPGPIVRGYSAGGFLVDGAAYPALFLTPHGAQPWAPPALQDLTVSHFDAVLGLSPAPEFLLLGTGEKLVFPPRSLVRALDERGVGIETMDSRAAARTWGVLRAEERWIVAALMPLV